MYWYSLCVVCVPYCYVVLFMFVCCALFEHGWLYRVLWFTVLPLSPICSQINNKMKINKIKNTTLWRHPVFLLLWGSSITKQHYYMAQSALKFQGYIFEKKIYVLVKHSFACGNIRRQQYPNSIHKSLSHINIKYTNFLLHI